MASFLDSETQGHQLKYGKEIMALSTVRKNLALRHFLWATTKLQRLGPDRAFQRGISHRYCVSNSIVNSCFSWCLLWPGLKRPLHGKHLPSRVSEGKIAERERYGGRPRVQRLLSDFPLSACTDCAVLAQNPGASSDDEVQTLLIVTGPTRQVCPHLSHRPCLTCSPVLWPGQCGRAGRQAWAWGFRGAGGGRPGPVRWGCTPYQPRYFLSLCVSSHSSA